MDSKTQTNDIPTALPGFEDEEAREKLLAEATAAESETYMDEDRADLTDDKGDPRPIRKSGLRVMRTIAGFGVFVGLLALAISWFFGIGWFAASKAQPVSRNSPKDASPAPATEDEKLKMALSMVANEPKTNETSPVRIDPEKTNSTTAAPADTGPVDEIPVDGGVGTKARSGAGGPQFGLPPRSEISAQKDNDPETTKLSAEKKEPSALTTLRTDPSAETPGRSLFFGVIRKPPAPTSAEQVYDNTAAVKPTREAPRDGIPFGTLLPVRLTGSMYTLKNSGGVVRLELTRPVEGKGYSYPAGTVLIGNARGGESERAFVTVIGLIDPVSDELVKFGGDLLGRDGASGIEGKRRRLTSQWARFFNGLKETASSVLGSVGALRSGGTVILSEPLRRGSESMSEDLSDALLGNGKETTFIEVVAGASGYVLVTDLPKSPLEATTDPRVQGTDK